MIKLVVGLGNPGKRYEWTRHNLGFLTIDCLADRWGISFRGEKGLFGELGKAEKGDVRIYLLKPMTFMNRSGDSVLGACRYYRIEPENVLVIADDAALSFGRLRVRPFGGSGGHNGLRDIEKKIGPGYPRLRMGIGAPRKGPLEDYVLREFDSGESEELEAFLEEGAEAVKVWVESGLQEMMNRFNADKT